MIRRTHESAARRASRAAFAAAAAVALYTAAAFGALLYAGLVAPLSCLLAAACGVGVALIAAKVVLRHEVHERERRFAQAQLESARDRAKDVATPVAPTPPPARVRAPAPPAAADAPERREIRESREIQSALLPREVPFVEGYHVEVDYQPCGALGGDFYDFRPFEDGRLLMTLGDRGRARQGDFRHLAGRDPRSDGPPADVGRRRAPPRAPAEPVGEADDAGRRARPRARPGGRDRLSGLARRDHHRPRARRQPAPLHRRCDLGEHRLRAAAAAAILPGPHGALQRLRDDLWEGGGRRDDTTLMLVSRLGEPIRDRLASDRTAQAKAQTDA